MIIPKNLSKIKNTLLLVCSKQNMVIYGVKKNSINKLLEFGVVLKTYSDNEGHFKVRSQGKIMKSGSVREVDRMEIILKFTKRLKSEIKYLKIVDYDYVYLFCPSYIKNNITKALPLRFNKKLEFIFEGNYYSKKPIFLLKKILNSKVKNKPILKLNAQKIIKKSNKARKFIKGKSDYN